MTKPYLRGKVYYGRVPHPDGGSAVRRLSPNKQDAKDMLKVFATFRAEWYPALRAIHAGTRSAASVFTHWQAGTLATLLRELQDVDLEPLVAEWHAGLVAQYGADEDTPYRYHLHCRALIPEGQPCLRSTFTSERITTWLAGLPVKTATRRRYHAAVASFCGYLRRRQVLDRVTDPMPDVPLPKAGDKRVRYLTRPEWTTLLACLHPRLRPIGVLATIGAELGAILRVRVRDVDPTQQTIHLRGKREGGEEGGATKTRTRARLLSVPQWAWPAVQEMTRGKLPDALLIGQPAPSTTMLYPRWAEACEAAGITDYTIHDGRHTYAVWMLSAGAPAEVVRVQRGGPSVTNLSQGRRLRHRPRASVMRCGATDVPSDTGQPLPTRGSNGETRQVGAPSRSEGATKSATRSSALVRAAHAWKMARVAVLR